jgi:hypothetical protein
MGGAEGCGGGEFCEEGAGDFGQVFLRKRDESLSTVSLYVFGCRLLCYQKCAVSLSVGLLDFPENELGLPTQTSPTL